MTRTSGEELFEFDPEIAQAFHALQRAERDSPATSNSSSLDLVSSMTLSNNETLRELATPDVSYQLLCIQYLELKVDFELKFGIIHLLPKFHGLSREDPNMHL